MKVVIILALFITFVNSNNEGDFDNLGGSNLPPGEIQTKTQEENQNIAHPIVDHAMEEEHTTKPCKVDVDLLNNINKSGAPIAKKDAQIKTIFIDKLNATDKVPSKLSNLESINVDKNDPTINTKSKKRSIETPEGTLPTRRILPGILENPTTQQSGGYKPYQNKGLHDESNIWNNRRNLFPNIDEMSNSYDAEKVKKREVNDMAPEDEISEDSVESKFIDPTVGKGIYDMKNTKVMLLEHTRVCYACSTLSNPTCWSPDKRTTVKYCQKGDNICLTKTFQYKGTSLIIRDCGNSCETQNANDKYSSCTTCHSDLCNGAATVIFNTGVAMIVLLGLFFNRQ